MARVSISCDASVLTPLIGIFYDRNDLSNLLYLGGGVTQGVLTLSPQSTVADVRLTINPEDFAGSISANAYFVPTGETVNSFDAYIFKIANATTIVVAQSASLPLLLINGVFLVYDKKSGSSVMSPLHGDADRASVPGKLQTFVLHSYTGEGANGAGVLYLDSVAFDDDPKWIAVHSTPTPVENGDIVFFRMYLIPEKHHPGWRGRLLEAQRIPAAAAARGLVNW